MKKTQPREFHVPVLLQAAVDFLKVKPGHWYVDATIGGGGHAREIIRQGGRVLGIDWDKQALMAAKEHLQKAGPDASWQLVKGSFADLQALVGQAKIKTVAGVLFDLGVSSHQLDSCGRGFSFQIKEDLDMRMDPDTQAVTAKDLLTVLYEKELCEIFKKFADENLARPIARRIVRFRRVRPITTTKQLKRIVAEVYSRKKIRQRKIDPATKVFQALRIAVNDELNNLKSGLSQAFEILKPKGRLVVISFHSGEDRIVKQRFRQWKQEGEGEVLTKKPIMPSDKEKKANPRARSAKLRAIEKLI